MNDCMLHAATTDAGDIADAWASGFGIYPALETAAAPAGSVSGMPSPASRRGASRRLAVAGLVLGAIGLFALIADVATIISHG
jgi:hypothetical protein